MLMGMGVEPVSKGFAKSPKADADEHQSNQPFAPGRDDFDRDDFAKKQREDSDQRDSAGMADSPAHSDPPGLALTFRRQRSDGCEMVRSRKNVKHAGDQTGENREHHDRTVRKAMVVWLNMLIPAPAGRQVAAHRKDRF